MCQNGAGKGKTLRRNDAAISDENMTIGLKNNATRGCEMIDLGGDNHATPENLVRELLGQDDETPNFEGVANLAEDAINKPARSLVDRLIVTPVRNVKNAVAVAKQAVLSYRPTPRHMSLLLMIIVLLIVPWLLPSLIAILLGLVATTYLVIGHNYSTKMVASWFNWLKRRDSHGAEIIRSRAERVSNRLTRWIDRLPVRWTSGLYLPDFAITADFSEKLKSDPFARLAGETQNQ